MLRAGLLHGARNESWVDEKRERVPGHYGVIRTYDWHKTEFNEQARDASLIFETLCLQEVLLFYLRMQTRGLLWGHSGVTTPGKSTVPCTRAGSQQDEASRPGFYSPRKNEFPGVSNPGPHLGNVDQ